MERKHVWQPLASLLMIIAMVFAIGSFAFADEPETVVVGTNAEYAPFEYLDENGELTGFDIELMEAIAEEENFTINWRDLPFDSLIGAMEAGDLQVIAAAIGPTEERAQSVDFSDVYYTGSQSIICTQGVGYETLDDLAGLKVAVLEGATADLIVSGENTDFGEAKDIKVKRFKNAGTAVMELKNGGADAVMIDTIMAEIYCQETGGIEYHVVAGTENDTVLCLTKGDKALAAMINDGIAKISENGKYDELYTKYFGGQETDGNVAGEKEAADVDGHGQTVVVGTNAEYAPFEYLDENGALTGFDVELMEAIAKEANFVINWRDLPFDSLIGAMEAGDLQVIAAAIGPTEERAQSVDFSEVYYTGSQSIICPEDKDLTNLDDLAGLKVAVLEGATADLIVSGENTDFGEAKDIKVKRFKNAGTAVMELKNGGADAVMIDTIMAEIYCQETSGIKYNVVAGTENDTVLCLTKGDAELAALVNGGLAKVNANGTYDALYEKYFAGQETDGNVVSDGSAETLGGGQTVVVGTNAEYAPFEYLDEDGALTGFDIDLMEAIAKAADFVIDWRDLPFDSLIGSMEAGDIQVIAAAIGPTEERAQSVDFSEVYYTGSQSIMSPVGTDYETLADLKGLKVAVLEGATADLIVSGENTDFGVAEDITVVRFKNAGTAVMELKNGGTDAVMIDTIMAEIYCQETTGLQFHKVDGTENDTVFCITKGDTELADLVNTGLKKVVEDGTYDALYGQYFGGDETDGALEVVETVEEDEKGFIDTLKFIFLKENRWKYYVNGLGLTLLVSFLSVFVGIALGLIVAIARIDAQRRNKKTIFSVIASAYVDIIRGTPSVLQLMIIYFAVFHSKLGLVAAVCSFGINSGAYVSEVIRGGIQSIDKGQMEAGRSLGLSYGDTLRFIIIPQAVKNILPALGNEFILLIKETSILGYIGMFDLTKASNYVLSRTYQMFIPLITAGIIYYVIVKALSMLMQYFERRLRESD